MSTIFVALPVYNEAARLQTLLERIGVVLDGRAYRIVAVDDGSRDGSDAILAQARTQLPVEIITHPVNRGLADTLYDGLRWVAEHSPPDDVVVTMDADDT